MKLLDETSLIATLRNLESARIQGARTTRQDVTEALARVEKQYERILARGDNLPNILFGLGRVCQHNLSHWKTMEHLRMLQDPDWRQPEGMTWEKAVDYMTGLLVSGTEVA